MIDARQFVTAFLLGMIAMWLLMLAGRRNTGDDDEPKTQEYPKLWKAS